MTPPPPYRTGDAVRVLIWKDGLSGWRRTEVLSVVPDTGLSGYTWAVTVHNPEPGRWNPPTLTVGAWDNGHGNGLQPG